MSEPLGRRPLRIAFLTPSLDVGGAERKMILLAERLDRDRYQTEFVLLMHAGALGPAAEATGSRIRVLGWPSRHGRLHRLRWGWDVARLGPQLRAGHYDIIHALLFNAAALAALTQRLSGTPILIAGRERMDDYKERFGPLDRFLDGQARRSSDVVVAASEAVRDDVIRHEHIEPAKTRVIRNGVVLPPPMPPSERSAIRAAWGFGPDDLVVGCVANYKPAKGLELLLRVAADLRSKAPHLRLVLVGEGELRPTLERMIADLHVGDIVRLHGRELDARRLYGAFDIYAHASESEGGPNAAIEAAAAGRPIVATGAGGTREVVIDGEGGLLVAINDEAAFSAALMRMLSDGEMRKTFGAAARDRAERLFSAEQFVADTAALYEEMAESKGIRR
jgi:glycosyltransferase involved in cell wall biosynthesis